MNLNDILKQYDPAQEANDADVARMRKAIMTAKRPAQQVRPAIVALALLVIIASGVIGALSDRHAEPPIQQPAARELNITTPGGTRLIWVYNERASM